MCLGRKSYYTNKSPQVMSCQQVHTVKPVLSSHSKEDQRLVFKTNYSLMHVCNTFDLH